MAARGPSADRVRPAGLRLNDEHGETGGGVEREAAASWAADRPCRPMCSSSGRLNKGAPDGSDTRLLRLRPKDCGAGWSWVGDEMEAGRSGEEAEECTLLTGERVRREEALWGGSGGGLSATTAALMPPPFQLADCGSSGATSSAKVPSSPPTATAKSSRVSAPGVAGSESADS